MREIKSESHSSWITSKQASHDVILKYTNLHALNKLLAKGKYRRGIEYRESL